MDGPRGGTRLVRNSFGIGSSLGGSSDGSGTDAKSRAGEAEGVHDGMSGRLRLLRDGSSGEVVARIFAWAQFPNVG